MRPEQLGWEQRPLSLLLVPFSQLSPGSEDDEGHDGSNRENLGRIQFSVGYNFQESTLTVKIMKAQELPAKDFSGTSDPFVKIYLLPDKKHKLETKVKRKNLNPHWNETFLFEGMGWQGKGWTPTSMGVTSWPPSPAQGSPTRRWCSGCCTFRSWTMTASAVTTPLGRCPSPSTRWTSPRCRPSGRT